MSLVSVVMSAYNAEKFIARSIESILNQSLTDFEFIIINDGSSDKTGEIINLYAARDSRIKPIHRANKGLTQSLNEGVSLSTSRYIARMDADDISHYSRLELEYNFLESHRDYVLVGTDYSEINTYNTTLRTVRRPNDNDSIRLLMHVSSPFAHGSVMYTKDAFNEAGGYTLASGSAEDYDLWSRLIDTGKVYILPKTLFSWRISDSNITTVKSREVAYDAARVRRYINSVHPISLSPGDIVSGHQRYSKERFHYIFDSYGRIVIFQLKNRLPYGIRNLKTLLFSSGKIGKKIILHRFLQILTGGKKSLDGK